MFVRYSCGCIGLPPMDRKTAIIVDNCDKYQGDPDGLGFYSRTMTESVRYGEEYVEKLKSFEILSEEEDECLIKNLNHQLGDGIRLRELRKLINPIE